MVAYFLHLGGYGVVIGHGLLTLVFYLVGHLAGFNQVFHPLLDDLYALGNLFDDFHVAATQTVDFLGGEDIAHVVHVLGQLALVMGGHGDDVVHGEVAHHSCLYLYALGVSVPFHLVAGFQFLAGHHVELLKHGDGFRAEVVVEDDRAAGLTVESSLLGFFHPLVRIAVAVETDRLAGLDVFTQHVDDCAGGCLSLGDERIHALFEEGECLSHGSVEGYHSRRTVGLAAHGTELEAVAGEGEWRGAVAVGIVDKQFGNFGDVELHALLAGHGKEVVVVAILDMVKQFGELRAKER